MFAVYYPASDSRSRNVTCLLEDRQGSVWCGTTGGLYRLARQNGQLSFRLIDLGMPADNPEYSHVNSLIEDRRGDLWIGSNSGIYRLSKGGLAQRYDLSNGLPDINVNSLLEDRDGRLWAGMRGGLCNLATDPDPAGRIVRRVYSSKDGLVARWINQIFQATDGTLWAGSNVGLVSFTPDPATGDYRFRIYAEPNGLPYREVQSITEDRNGNLWLGLGNGGAIKLARSGITAFTAPDGLGWAAWIYETRAGELLVGGGQSYREYFVNRYNGERFEPIKLIARDDYGWGWNQILFNDRDGDWWLATRKGLMRFPAVRDARALAHVYPRTVYTTRDGLAGNLILRLLEDSNGDIWISSIGARNGLSRWERATNRFHHYTQQDDLPSLADAYPTSFCEDRAGNLWIGFSVGGGLVRYRDGRFTGFGRIDGVPEGGIFNLFVDSSGRLWVPTTRGGVCRIDHPETERPEIVTYTARDGLSSNDATSVTEDSQGRIYIGTSRAIDRLDPATGRIKHYTTADGALLGDVGAAFRDRRGTLWFSSPTGLARLIPEPDRPPAPPPILITGLGIGGNARPVSALGLVEAGPLELGADARQIQIEFVALGFSPGEGLLYQYKLEGGQQDWSTASNQRVVNFANLAPGRYRFVVRAVNADGVSSETPASFSFTVLPPLWQRWWFVGAAVVLAGLFVYSLYRYRLAQLLRLERVRTRIAADLHDDIGANLSKIAVLSEVAHHQLGGESRVADSTLSSIANISRESVASMRDIVWAVNPRRDRLFDLTRRMRGFASDIFTSRNIEFQFHAPERDRELKLGADVRRDVFLIFKEAVNNAVRHSGCANAAISLGIETGMLALVITDDGKGLGSVEDDEGQGISGMRRRAENFGGKLDIISHGGEGTTVRLLVPIGNRRWTWPRGDGAKNLR
jgi:ligand-binding sensor domain-containing protein/two-component sensor histidine kinase